MPVRIEGNDLKAFPDVSPVKVSWARRWHQGLAMVMRRYGFFALDVDHGSGSTTSKFKVINTCFDEVYPCKTLRTAVFVGGPDDARVFGLEGKREHRGALLKQPKRNWLRRRCSLYRPLLDFVSFTGAGLTPLLQTEEGRTVVGWVANSSHNLLVIGLDVVEELIRYTQGNPERVRFDGNRNLWGAGHEQPAFLYDGHLASGYESEPWADKLGMLLAEAFATAADVPLLCPLPCGLRGAVILTGDDDQAWLEKYEEQLGILGDFPITYFLLPHTNHTPETLACMPESVEFGVHVDALDAPEHYDERCAQQTAEVRQLVGDRPVHTIRNHGHLNRDYWGHLHAWETAGLSLDFNIRGLDGTCPTGSYLPFRVRRPDGAWSSHASLFSTFSDSMFFLQNWPEKKQIKTIKRLADQINRTIPGVMVFNFHPQNVSQVPQVHRAVMQIGRRNGWRAFGAETFRQWLESVDGVRMDETDGNLFLCSSAPITGIALRWPGSSALCQLPTWQGMLKLATPSS
jgi:hypothetical protein